MVSCDSIVGDVVWHHEGGIDGRWLVGDTGDVRWWLSRLEARVASRKFKVGEFDVDSRKTWIAVVLHGVLVYLTPHSRG